MIIKLETFNASTGELVSKRYLEEDEALVWERSHTHADGIPDPRFEARRTPASGAEVEAWLYLAATDFYVVRSVETGDGVPQGVTEKRAAARLVLDRG